MSGYYTWKQATPAEMVKHFTDELARTPRHKIFKRLQIKRAIKFWSDKV